MTFGPLVIAAGVLLMLMIGDDVTYVRDVLPGAIVFGLGLSLMIAPLTATVLAAAPEEHAGIASGVNNAVARAGSLLAVAALPVVVGLHGDEYADPAAFDDAFRMAMMICAVLLAVGGVVSWLTIRPNVLEPDDEPAPEALDGGGGAGLGWDVGAHHETGCIMRNKVRATATMVRLLENARYEVLPTASIEATILEHLGTDAGRHRHRLAQQGARGDPRPGRAAHRARLHRGPAPGGPDGHATAPSWPRSATASPARASPGSSSPRATRTRPAATRTRCRCSRTSRSSGRRSRTSASPATPSRTRRSATTSRSSRCGTSAATRPTWSAT